MDVTGDALQKTGMEIIQAQYRQIAHCVPVQRGNVSLANLNVLNTIL